MKRILLCWELGQGLGHLGPLALLGEALEQTGCEVAFAVRDTELAEAVLGKHGRRWFQAPLPRGTGGPPTISYSDMLLRTGFHDVDALCGRLRAWRELLDLHRPERIVAEHAPTALLAARVAGMPATAVGNGFTLPPPHSPLPALRHLEPVAAERLHRLDEVVLTNCNRALKTLGGAPLQYPGELFADPAATLFTLPDLDHYPPRAEESYFGPLPPLPGGASPAWPAGTGKRVFAYLRPFAGLESFLDALAGSGCRVLAHLPGQDAGALTNRYRGRSMHFSPFPLDLAALAGECDLAVTHGGLSGLTTLLLAGVPQLVLPLHREMQITGRNVEALGAGLSAPQLRPAGMAHKLRRLLDEPGFAAAAADFARRHARLRPAQTPARFADRLARLA